MSVIQQLSPYGKDVQQELQDIYGMASTDHLLDETRTFLKQTYGLEDITFQSIHIAYCLCIKFMTQGRCYFLKFTAPSITGSPDELFDFVDFLHVKGMPVPQVVRTLSGTWWATMLENTPYSITYLLPEMPGTPLQGQSEEQVLNYARIMARFHLHGRVFAAKGLKIIGSKLSRKLIHERIRDDIPPLRPLLTEEHADLFSADTISIISRSIDRLLHHAEVVGCHAFEKTHIYDDIRLCHVFTDGDRISGLIDFDQAMYGERLIDVCYGIISAPDPDDGKAFSWEQQVVFFRTYHDLFPFTPREIMALPHVLAWANLVQLEDLIHYHHLQTGRVSRDKLLQNVYEIEHLMTPGAFDFLQ